MANYIIVMTGFCVFSINSSRKNLDYISYECYNYLLEFVKLLKVKLWTEEKI